MLRPLTRRRRDADQPAQLTLLLRSAPRTADDLLARLRLLGLRRLSRCRLTRNRSVMVSFTGDELRVHQGYLRAPDDVLLALVQFVEGTTRRERSRARRMLLAYPIEERDQRVRRRDATHPDDQRLAEQLTHWHARYNAEYFGGELRAVSVRVSRRMRARLGHYTAARLSEPAEIAISRRHVRRHGWEEALQTLLHEMVHQWQDEHGLSIDHGTSFRAKAREIGIAPLARRTMAA